jgi:hypothetical protein
VKVARRDDEWQRMVSQQFQAVADVHRTTAEFASQPFDLHREVQRRSSGKRRELGGITRQKVDRERAADEDLVHGEPTTNTQLF